MDPVTISLLIGSALSSLYGAHKSANAAKTAAQQQLQSGQQALDFEKQMWGQLQGQAAPYLTAGTGAIGRLSDLLHVPGGSSPQGQPSNGMPSGALPMNQALMSPTLTGSAGQGYRPMIAAGSGQTPAAAAQGPQVGTRRLINGRMAQWDGAGWVAA
jgi:hypothetical protein